MNLHKFNYIDEPTVIGYTLISYEPYEHDGNDYVESYKAGRRSQLGNLKSKGYLIFDNYIKNNNKYLVIDMNFKGEFSDLIKKLLPDAKKFIREYQINSLGI
jgi:hypothetical protein